MASVNSLFTRSRILANKIGHADFIARSALSSSGRSTTSVNHAIGRAAPSRRNVFTDSSSSSSRKIIPSLQQCYQNSGGIPLSSSQTAMILFGGSTLVASSSSPEEDMVSCEGDKKGDDDDDVVTKYTKFIKGELEKLDFNQSADGIAKQVGGKIEEIIATGVPSQLSSGFIAGFCSGYALKKVGKAGAVLFGLVFCLLQSMSYAGYIQMDYDKLGKDMNNLLDLNQDGQVDNEDRQLAMDKVMEVLTYNIPAGSGFGAGFVAGVRAG